MLLLIVLILVLCLVFENGNRVWLSKSDNPNRKLKYTLEIIEVNNSKVGINTHSTNKIVLQALQNNFFKEFNNIVEIRPETKFGSNTRFDFLIINNNTKIFIEVKNVTLSRKKKVAEFPDAITTRGLKHINELIKASKKGYEIFIIFIIQRDDCNLFSIAEDIDTSYAEAIRAAFKKKLKIICYDCKFSVKGIKLNKKIKIKI